MSIVNTLSLESNRQINLLQMIYMIIAGYFEDDASDELTNDPVFKSILEKNALASQPTVSRFLNPAPCDRQNTSEENLQYSDAASCYSESGFHPS